MLNWEDSELEQVWKWRLRKLSWQVLGHNKAMSQMQLYQRRTNLVLEKFIQHRWRRISSKGWFRKILIDYRLSIIEYLMIEMFRIRIIKEIQTKLTVGEWLLLLCVMIENKGYGVELASFDDVWYNV